MRPPPPPSAATNQQFGGRNVKDVSHLRDTMITADAALELDFAQKSKRDEARLKEITAKKKRLTELNHQRLRAGQILSVMNPDVGSLQSQALDAAHPPLKVPIPNLFGMSVSPLSGGDGGGPFPPRAPPPLTPTPSSIDTIQFGLQTKVALPRGVAPPPKPMTLTDRSPVKHNPETSEERSVDGRIIRTAPGAPLMMMGAPSPSLSLGQMHKNSAAAQSTSQSTLQSTPKSPSQSTSQSTSQSNPPINLQLSDFIKKATQSRQRAEAAGRKPVSLSDTRLIAPSQSRLLTSSQSMEMMDVKKGSLGSQSFASSLFKSSSTSRHPSSTARHPSSTLPPPPSASFADLSLLTPHSTPFTTPRDPPTDILLQSVNNRPLPPTPNLPPLGGVPPSPDKVSDTIDTALFNISSIIAQGSLLTKERQLVNDQKSPRPAGDSPSDSDSSDSEGYDIVPANFGETSLTLPGGAHPSKSSKDRSQSSTPRASSMSFKDLLHHSDGGNTPSTPGSIDSPVRADSYLSERVEGSFAAIRERITTISSRLLGKPTPRGDRFTSDFKLSSKRPRSLISDVEKAAIIVQRVYRKHLSKKQFHHLIYNHLHSPIAPMLQQRNAIIRDLVRSERRYNQGLELLDEIFYRPFSAYADSDTSTMLTRRHLNTLFANHRTIMTVHQAFLLDLEKRCDDWPTVYLENVFQERLLIALSDYETYINNHTDAITCLVLLKDDPMFLNVLMEIEQDVNAGNLRFSDFLYLPLARIQEYTQFIQRLIPVTAHAPEENVWLREALVDIRHVSELITKNKIWMMNRDHLIRIKNILEGFTEDLDNGERQFIKEGILLIMTPSEDEIEESAVYAYLLSDALLLVNVGTAGAYVIQKWVPLDRATVETNVDDLEIRVWYSEDDFSPEVSLTLRVTNNIAFRRWSKDIRDVSTMARLSTAVTSWTAFETDFRKKKERLVAVEDWMSFHRKKTEHLADKLCTWIDGVMMSIDNYQKQLEDVEDPLMERVTRDFLCYRNVASSKRVGAIMDDSFNNLYQGIVDLEQKMYNRVIDQWSDMIDENAQAAGIATSNIENVELQLSFLMRDMEALGIAQERQQSEHIIALKKKNESDKVKMEREIHNMKREIEKSRDRRIQLEVENVEMEEKIEGCVEELKRMRFRLFDTNADTILDFIS